MKRTNRQRFRGREAKLFGAGIRQVLIGRTNSSAQISNGLNQCPGSVTSFFKDCEIAVEFFVAGRVGFVVADVAVEHGTFAGRK